MIDRARQNSVIGFIGIGVMGSGMVRNLLVAGHTVQGWTKIPAEVPEEVSGHPAFNLAETVAEAAGAVRTVMVSVIGPSAQDIVYFDRDGLLEGVAQGATIIDLTTSSTSTVIRLAEAVRARGCRFIDAPVFGTRNHAWDGTLDVVCGGTESDVKENTSLLETIAKSVHYLGPTPAGTSMKLVGNLLVAAYFQAVGEAMSLAVKSGLSSERVLDTLEVVNYASEIVVFSARRTLEDEHDPMFFLRLMLKDLRLIQDEARRLEVPVPVTGAIAELYQAAMNLGMGELNASAIGRLMRYLSGLNRDRRFSGAGNLHPSDP